MTTVFHTWAYGKFIEIQSNLRKKKLKAPVFLEAVSAIEIMLRAPIQFRREG